MDLKNFITKKGFFYLYWLSKLFLYLLIGLMNSLSIKRSLNEL